jgi:chromosome segregation ATPase
MILEKKYSNVNETISNLDMRLNSYRSSIANENEKTLDNRDTIGDIEKKLKRTLNDMKAAKKFVKETEESISEIDKEVVKKKKGAELNQQTKTRLQQLGKERKEKETNLEEMTIQYNDYEKLKDNIDAHVKKLHDEIKQSEKDIDTYQNIISEMGKDIQKRTNEKNDMKKDHIHLEKKVRRLEDNQTHIIMSGSK